MTGSELRNLAYVMANMDRDTLEQAGVMKPGQVGGGDWKRYNDDPLTFIMKLADDKLAAFVDLLNEEMAPRR